MKADVAIARHPVGSIVVEELPDLALAVDQSRGWRPQEARGMTC